VVLQVEGVGAFVRTLLPIHLTGGYAITVGTWLAVPPDDLRYAWEVWWDSEKYPDLRLEGFLANAVPPWGKDLLAKPATALVRNPEQVPYLTDSSDELLKRILEAEWPHEEVLDALDRPAPSDR
jgi:hypothetical protein